MITLERHCRLLLRAYPSGYRRDRGEEIIGTLLDATPAGRSWPTARDFRSVVVGGLRARAALNQRRTTAANLRTPALVGVSAYLAFVAVSDLCFVVFQPTAPTGHAHMNPWPALLVWALVGVAVAAAWAGSRRVLVLVASIGASVALALATTLLHGSVLWSVPELACLAAVVVLARRTERPGRSWFLLVALAAAVPLQAYLVPGVWPLSSLALLEAIGAVSLIWVIIDARPAIATVVFLVAMLLPAGIGSLAAGPDIGADVPLLIVIALAAIAVWRLHQQSARAPARRES